MATSYEVAIRDERRQRLNRIGEYTSCLVADEGQRLCLLKNLSSLAPFSLLVIAGMF